MLIHVNDPSLLRDLMASLRRAGCSCRRTGRASVEIRHPAAVDEREERLEVTFFVKAWAVQHPGVCVSFA
jgi:hypothetical protein